MVEFSWQQNHMNYYGCFTLHFYLENDMPVLTGRFLSMEDGETRESGKDAFSNPIPWQLTWVQWFELQNMLAESELPEYQEPSPDTRDETDSKICIVWRTVDGESTEICSGNDHQNTSNLQKLVSFHDKSSSSLCCLFFNYFAARFVPHSTQNTLLPFSIPHDVHFQLFSGAGIENTHTSVSSANSTSNSYTTCAACAS